MLRFYIQIYLNMYDTIIILLYNKLYIFMVYVMDSMSYKINILLKQNRFHIQLWAKFKGYQIALSSKRKTKYTTNKTNINILTIVKL